MYYNIEITKTSKGEKTGREKYRSSPGNLYQKTVNEGCVLTVCFDYLPAILSASMQVFPAMGRTFLLLSPLKPNST
jgi:hypothetical protein